MELFAGILGNIQAINKNVRYIENDLNRMWESDFVYDILKEDVNKQMNEVKEMHEIIITLRNYVITGKYNKLYLLDLHTTSSDGILSFARKIKKANKLPAIYMHHWFVDY